MEQASKRKLKNSVQLKFAGYFAVLIAVLLIGAGWFFLSARQQIKLSQL